MATIDLRVTFNKTTLTILTVILAVLVLGALVYHQNQTPSAATTQLPTEIVKQAKFAIYAPVAPPPGFSLDKDSISNTAEAFVYSYTYDSSKHLAISVQPLPKNFDASNFKPDKEAQTRIGRAYFVDLETRTTAAVVADNSLLFINAPQKISVDILEQFINSMSAAK